MINANDGEVWEKKTAQRREVMLGSRLYRKGRALHRIGASKTPTGGKDDQNGECLIARSPLSRREEWKRKRGGEWDLMNVNRGQPTIDQRPLEEQQQRLGPARKPPHSLPIHPTIMQLLHIAHRSLPPGLGRYTHGRRLQTTLCRSRSTLLHDDDHGPPATPDWFYVLRQCR